MLRTEIGAVAYLLERSTPGPVVRGSKLVLSIKNVYTGFLAYFDTVIPSYGMQTCIVVLAIRALVSE